MAIRFNNVSNKKSYRPLKFKNLTIGDIFYSTALGSWCMIIPEGYDCEGNIDFNSVDLASGNLFFHPETVDVKKLNKDLTIDYTEKDLVEWVG